MLRRHHNLIWLFLALAFLAQSLLPTSAVAEISVRCVGAPAASPPCARMVVSLSDRRSIASRLSVMPCCRDMVSCRAMMSGCDGKAATATRYAAIFSTPKCLVTINPLNTPKIVNVPRIHRWLLHSAPALAPPAVPTASVLPVPAAIFAVSPACFSVSPSLLASSHGLRAPPAA